MRLPSSKYCHQNYLSFVIIKEESELTEFCKLRLPVYKQTQFHTVQLELFKDLNKKGENNENKK